MSRKKFNAACHHVHQYIKTVDQRGMVRSKVSLSNSRYILLQITKQLYDGGYVVKGIHALRDKHVHYLVKRWQQEGLNAGTIKNRMSVLRKALTFYHRPAAKLTNTSLKLEQRQYVPTQTKAIWQINTDNIDNPYLRYSIRLQQAFGLRREEAIKIIMAKADEETALRIQGSWTKGNVERLVPILTNEQRCLVDEIRQFCGKGSLIPSGRSYRQQLRHYEALCKKLAFKHLHGLRHAYAQRRYRVLTDYFSGGCGWECSFNGGKTIREMRTCEREVDACVRAVISSEMGHSRADITRIYCGK